MLYGFDVVDAVSIEHASRLLLEHGEAATVYAGGTALLTLLKNDVVDYDLLVNVKTIPGLTAIAYDEAARTLRLGALGTHRAIERSPIVQRYCPLLAEVEQGVGNVRVRNVGTIGGNLCLAEPLTDVGATLMALGASVRLERAGGSRLVPVEAFWLDAYATAREPGELLTEVLIPVQPHRRAIYRKFQIHAEKPSVGLALAIEVTPDGQRIAAAELVVSCLSGRPVRLPRAGEILRGEPVEHLAQHLDELAALPSTVEVTVPSLAFSAEYRHHLAGVLVRRAANEVTSHSR